MKKYISCIILILLCIICATVFYVNAKEVDDSDDTKDSLQKENEDEIEENKTSIDKNGTFLSERLCDTALRVEWSLYKKSDDELLYLSLEVYLDTPEQITAPSEGYISVNGLKKEFATDTKIGTTNLLASHSLSLNAKDTPEIEIIASLKADILTDCNTRISELSVKGKIITDERYLNVDKSKQINIKHISQFPELASGDEITSLCMVLNYLKYEIDKCELSDLYLDKGPAGNTNIFEANAGNPESAYNSYGCMPPVIVKAGNKYITTNGGKSTAIDISGYSCDMLYYEVSQGNPVIVWACEDFNIAPSVFRTLIIDGKNVYLKSNVSTMVLTGYDFEKKTVTLSSPAGSTFDLDMALFEKRYGQVGSYAVVIK